MTPGVEGGNSDSGKFPALWQEWPGSVGLCLQRGVSLWEPQFPCVLSPDLVQEALLGTARPHSFSKSLLSTCYVSRVVLDAGDTARNRKDMVPALMKAKCHERQEKKNPAQTRPVQTQVSAGKNGTGNVTSSGRAALHSVVREGLQGTALGLRWGWGPGGAEPRQQQVLDRGCWDGGRRMEPALQAMASP